MASDYPDQVFCPLLGKAIDAIDCMETQDCADGILKDASLLDAYKQRDNWRAVCQACKYHETE